MDIFNDVKSRVSAKTVSESYGLKIGRNGMACCPFHNDKHPSMKIDDKHYHCFGCGAHGDAIGYVAQMYGISQYEAAIKINEDFHLGIDLGHKPSEEEWISIQKRLAEAKKIADIQNRFRKWKLQTIDELLECENLIEESEKAIMNESPHVVFLTNGFVYMMHMKSIIGYWLDILCMGTEDEAKEFFLTDGKEVSRIVANIRCAGDDILGRSRKCAG